MKDLRSTIANLLRSRGFAAGGIDGEAWSDQILPVAEEHIVLDLLNRHCSNDDRELFRDSYLSAPDIFDPMEFLRNRIPSFEARFDESFDEWFDGFSSKLK